ncbi:MAG: hypothetical protein ACKPKO_59225, partial [Candidatus Fonsibacter sp.]
MKDLQGDNGDAIDIQSLPVHSANEMEDSLELYYTADMSKLAYRGYDGDRLVDVDFPRPGEHLCVSIYPVTAAAQAVVKRDDALLTQEEVQKHWPAVLAAIKQELETWVKYGCISRKPRKLARNIIDVKWVIKWKFEQTARSVQESQQSGPS